MGWEKCAVHFSNTDNVERLSIEYWCIDWLHQLRFMMEHNQDHSSGIPLPPPSSSWWSQGINYHSHHLPWLGVLPWEQTSSVIRLTTSWCRAAILTGNSRSSNISSIWIIDNNSLSLSLSHMLSVWETPADWLKCGPTPTWRKYCSLPSCSSVPTQHLPVFPPSLTSSLRATAAVEVSQVAEVSRVISFSVTHQVIAIILREWQIQTYISPLLPKINESVEMLSTIFPMLTLIVVV